MATVTDDSISPKRSGGRPQSEGWTMYSFEKVDGDKGKCLAKCKKCLNVLQNTSLVRMANHRKRCGLLQGNHQEALVQAPKATPKTVVVRKEEPRESQPVLYITESDNIEYIEETPAPVERVQQTSIEIINEDINRHRRSSKAGKSRFGSVDAALSSFLIGCNLPFDIIDSSHFKKFVNALNPNCLVPSSSQLKQRVLSKLQAEDASSPVKRKRYETSDTE